MPNRSGRSVGAISPFDPKGALPDGLPAVQRGAGADSEALFQVGSDLAGVFGHMADRAAAIEGKQAGAVAGNEPGFRPTGTTSIRGKAFDEAAVSTYQDGLDAKIRKGMLDIFQQNKDNPGGLSTAFDAFKKDILDNDTFPAIRGSVESSFERLRLPFQVKATEALDTKVQDQARAANLEATTRSGAVVAAATESSPYSPKTQAVVRQELDAQAERDQQLVKSGAMTAEAATKNRILRERDATTREAVAATEKLPTVADVDKAEAEYRKKKAEGTLGPAGTDAAAMDTIEAGFARRRQQLATVGRQASASIEKQADDIVSRAQEGAFPPADELARFRGVAAQAPNGEAAVGQLDRRLGWVRSAAVYGPDNVEAVAREMRRAAGSTPTKEQAQDIQFLDDLTGKYRKATTEDPIGLAKKLQVGAVNPISVDSPDALRASIAERSALAKGLPSHLNPDRKMLEPGDVKAIERKIAMGGEAAVDTVKALVEGAGRDAPRLMREIGGTAPELAQAGLLLASGGSRQAARDIIAAVVARGLPGGERPLEVDNASFRAVWAEKIGTSLVYNSQDSQRIEKAARAIAATRLRTVADNKSSDAKDIYGQAIEEAFGGQRINGQSFGGIGRVKTGWFTTAPVPLPPDVKADRFPDALAAIRDDDLATLPVPPVAGTKAAQVRNARPVPVPGGYRFALGDPAGNDPKFIEGQDGKPFVLPWDAISGRLRERAPGAFVGAR